MEKRHVAEVVPFDTLMQLQEAISMVAAGQVTKIHVTPTIKVYKCTNVVRVDINIGGMK